MSDQFLLERIKKLMALSQSSNPNEAAIALARAQKLMKENEISSEDLELSSFAEERIPTVRGLRDSKISSHLANIVAKALGLEFFRTVTSSGNSSYITFIGPHDRLKSGVYVYTILTRQVQIVKQQYRIVEKEKIRNEIISSLKNSAANFLFTKTEIDAYVKKETSRLLSKKTKIYLEGWLYSVRQKVQDFVSSPQEQDLLSSFMLNNHPEIKFARGRSRYLSKEEIDAYRLGKADGSNGFDLLKGINGQLRPGLYHKKN